jgi:hypothetical protein
MLKNINRSLNKLLDIPWVSALAGMVLIAYASLVAPDLPPFIANLFGNPIFKTLFMFTILVMRQVSPTLALLISVSLIISLQTFHRYESYAALKDWKEILKQKNHDDNEEEFVSEQNVEQETESTDSSVETGDVTQVMGVSGDDVMGAQGLNYPYGFPGTREGASLKYAF